MSEQTWSRVGCPSCSAAIEHRSDLSPWCTRCEWNLDPLATPIRSTRGARIQRRVAHRATQGLNAKVIAAQGTKRPRWRPSRLLAGLMACVVHSITIVLIVGGVFVAVVTPFRLLGIFLGVVMIWLGALLVPRVQRLPRGVHPVSREAAPELYRLVDAARTELRAPMPELAVVASYNAWTTRYGWRHHRWLVLGLPLWDVLDGQDRVALLGHELAHFCNGDVRRNGLVGSALNSLYRWRVVLHPARDVSDAGRYAGSTEWGNLASAAEWLSRFFLLALSGIAWLADTVMLAATARDSQESEYWADAMAVRLGGRRAAEQLLGRIELHRTYDTMLTSALRRADPHAMAIAAKAVRDLPASEVNRRVLAVSRRERNVFQSHPPTDLRIAFTHSREDLPPGVVLTGSQAVAIDGELGHLRPTIAQELHWQRAAR